MAQLAQKIQTASEKHTGLNIRGVIQNAYYALRENNNLSMTS